jgi:hypothetical protein
VSADPPEPQAVCRALLAALSASDGRRKKRKRDTTPDSIGMAMKRELLDRAVRDAPPAEEFEAWLLRQCQAMVDEGIADIGGVRAMAKDIFDEWQYAVAAPSFREWLDQGAPSADGEE